MAETARWYVVHTYSGYEQKVCTTLAKMVENRHMQDLIMETKIPTELVTEVKDNAKREVEQKLFPGYVLVKMIMTDDSWYVVRNTRGVTGFVGAASKPEPLTDAEVEALGVETRSIKIDYQVGDTVEILDGPLSGTSGTVTAIDLSENRVNVAIFIMSRETPVELDLDQVSLISEE